MRVTHSQTTGPVGEAGWNADHTIADADFAAAGDLAVLETELDAHVTDPHTDPAHTHDTTHDHDADYSGTGHSHDTSHNHDAAYAAIHAGHVHSHTAADVGAAETAHTHDTSHNHDGTYAAPHAHPYSADDHTHPGGSEAFPVGSIFMAAVSTNPATLLGYGTWSAWGAGRVILSRASGSAGDTGGSDTHTHAAHTGVISHTHTVTVDDPQHAHVENSNNATTGGLRGWGAPDTSTNTSQATGYSTANAATGITASTANPAGGVASLTHDTPSNLPPYIVTYVWQRTA